MATALWLLTVQGVIGAFDTLYFHEWRARLPARGTQAAAELKLHALRDFLYAVIFGTLPWVAWQGFWTFILVGVLMAEVIFTFADFVVEMTVRKPLGDVYAGERITHAVMGIIYGAMLASLLPVLRDWWSMPTALARATVAVPEVLSWMLTTMAAGVFASGIRDLYAAFGLPFGGWPWRTPEVSRRDASANNMPSA
jgi:hypothetical protein